MRKFGLVSGILVLVVIIVLSHSGVLSVPDKSDGIFIHMSHGADDAHRVMMPLSLANKLCDEYKVQLFLDIEAVHIIVQDAEPLKCKGFVGDSRKMLQQLIDRKVPIYVCPMCLKHADYSEDQLIEGVELASVDIFSGFAEGTITALDW